jgi:hypothetical protein
MDKQEQQVDQSSQVGATGLKRLRLIVRILSVLIIAFALFMFIMHILFPEPTVEDYPLIENLQPVVMMLSVLSLALAWRWEILGGTLSLVFFLIVLGLFWGARGYFFPLNVLIIFSPLPVTAILFLYLGWSKKRGEGSG